MKSSMNPEIGPYHALCLDQREFHFKYLKIA